MKRYRIGVIGAGARGESFARSLYAGSDRAGLFGLCDLDGDRLERFVAYCGLANARTFTDPAAFFAEPDLDAVIVTTPDFTHRDVAIQALRAGKDVYLEKPVAPTAAQCRDIIRVQRETGRLVFVGFNLRAAPASQRVKDILGSGLLGQILHVEGLEQLRAAHSASFMRRFHRKRSNTGGILNHKCCHDLDLILWSIGHQHRVVKVASFAGLNVFQPGKAPAKTCRECPPEVYRDCPYKDQAGFVFPVRGDQPIHHRQADVYGADLCVYNDDKAIFDNQTVIFEWDHGVRGNFNLQLFQARGRRETRIWGERGQLTAGDGQIRTVLSTSGDTIEHAIPSAGPGGHGGTDPKMLGRFVEAMDRRDPGDSGLAEGLAVTLLAEKAEQSALTGQVMAIAPGEYEA